MFEESIQFCLEACPSRMPLLPSITCVFFVRHGDATTDDISPRTRVSGVQCWRNHNHPLQLAYYPLLKRHRRHVS